MKKEFLINSKIFQFDEELITYDNNFAINEDDAKILLAEVDKQFSNIGLSYCLCFGSLLGAIREKGLIKGDEDIDILVYDENILYNNLPLLYERGLKVIRARKGKDYSFRINERCYIDVYILRPINSISIWKTYCYSLCGLYTPKKFFREFERVDFLGISCLCPKNPERILEFWYGKSWRTPIRGHKFYYEVRTHYYWKNVIVPTFLELIGYPQWRHLINHNYKSQSESIEDWKRFRS